MIIPCGNAVESELEFESKTRIKLKIIGKKLKKIIIFLSLCFN